MMIFEFSFVCKIPLLARRATRPMQPAGQARRARIGFLVYKVCIFKLNRVFSLLLYIFTVNCKLQNKTSFQVE